MSADKSKPPKPGVISHSREVEKTIVTAIERVGTQDAKRAYILFLSGPLVGKLHMLALGTTTMGRSHEATLTVNDNRVSRQHVAIAVEPGGRVVLRDLGSTNGTFVNGQRVEEHPLIDGDKVQISSATIFKFAWQDQTENIFHKELYKMAVIDPVTNIYNKRYFLERLREEFSHARRSQQPVSLMMCDIDHFKHVNDTHGHLAGDMILHQVAQRMAKVLRQEDLLARYGGEEFVLLMRGAAEANAVALGERIRTVIAEDPFNFESAVIPVTISIGVAALTPESIYENPQALIAAADACLYQSKAQGRNRVTAVGTQAAMAEK